MPWETTSPRRIRGPVLAGAVAATVLLGGCQQLDDAGSTLPSTDLVNDLASRLSAAADLIYSAEYALPDGAAGTISQAQGHAGRRTGIPAA
ncbi:hypothetical protein [Plantactinospora sp. KBS50]|uniref:hypothetical protein n=1 Tax=Plantactinospora sp. KBS50 TaxID=2024580 RepID=UPI001E4914C8|nr:hypothetical protein [Plantactinospora sp. KBS50]